jgi:3-deoxy-D-manno-octulosonic-acid transferase
LGRPLLLAASTHPGEELALAKVYQALRAQHPTLGFLIVPRHYERGAEVVAELEALDLQPLQRSQLAGESLTADVLVIDSTGELKAWQEHASIVVIGKSFLAEGGQNPAEAVMAGKPVVFGPHMENFEPLVRLLLDAGGAMQVADLKALQHGLQTLLAGTARCAELANAGQQALLKHQGATMKTAELVVGI